MKRSDLTFEVVNELVHYDPETGVFTWKERDKKWFKSGYRDAQGNANIWNSKWAGKEAFTSDNGDGYKTGAIFAIPVKAHRLAFLLTEGYWPDEVDHINGNRSDNRRINLREVDNIGQGRNQKLHATNTSGVAGVHWIENSGYGYWVARITVEGTRLNLGTSKDFDTAVSLRKAAEKKYGFHENHGNR